MDGVALLSVRSPVTKRMLLHLHRSGHALARELAEEVNMESRQVFPYLKPWFGRFVEVVKIGSLNLYRATEHLKRVAREVLEVLEEAVEEVRGKVTMGKLQESARKRYRERHGVDMDEDHTIVLQIFLDQALQRSSPYIHVDPGKGETLPKVVKTIARERHGKELDEERILEVLKDLELAHIIFIDRRHYKARLDKSLLGT